MLKTVLASEYCNIQNYTKSGNSNSLKTNEKKWQGLYLRDHNIIQVLCFFLF